MAPECSLRYKQQPTTGPYPQPRLLSIHFNIALPLTFIGLPRREKDDGQKGFGIIEKGEREWEWRGRWREEE